MDGTTLDQFAVFVTIIETGSFAAAARRMNRAQSAITYAIQKLEDHTQVALFDRSTYRPRLTEAGHALLPRARRIVDDVTDFSLLAKGIAKGIEAEVSMIVDAIAPIAPIVKTLKVFYETFPAVQVRVSVESFELTLEMLSNGLIDFAIVPALAHLGTELERTVWGTVDLTPVVAPDHPLAQLPAPIAPELLRDHLQIVLSTRLSTRDRPDHGVLSVNRWYVTDLETKHTMLLEGVGWGSMPNHRVAADLAAKRLVAIKPTRWAGIDQMPRIPFVIAHRRDRPLGQAARWLVRQLPKGDATLQSAESRSGSPRAAVSPRSTNPRDRRNGR